MTTFSVLAGSTQADLDEAPFAHLVRDAPLPEALYGRLAESFPPAGRFLGEVASPRSNQAVRIPAARVVDDGAFAAEWREFFRYHTSQAFWDDIVRVFAGEIRREHPGIEARAGRPLEEWRVKGRDPGADAEVELEVLFVINTAVEVESSVRPAHVDHERKIFAGIYYLRATEDTTPGGDLALYAFRDQAPAFGGHYAPLERLREEKRIDYRANRFVAFVNSPRSLHGVTPRPPTAHLRRYINFYAQVPFETFSLPKLSLPAQLRFWLARRKHKAPGITLRSPSE